MFTSKGFSKKKVIRTSRKGYIPVYLMMAVLLLIIAYIRFNGMPLNQNVLIAVIVFIILGFKITEVHRIMHHYDLTPTALEKVEGIFFQKIKRMNYHSISQLHLNQSPWDKILNIGTIEIAQFSETVRTEIKNINKPREFITEMSKRMHSKEVPKGLFG